MSFDSETMRNLNDDMVLEVISRLPLKEAIRCKYLSKDIHTYISLQERKQFVQSIQKICTVLHCSEQYPKIFAQVRLDPPYLSNYVDIYENLPILVRVMASCSGLLLLHFEIHNTYGVFNPITGEFQLVPNDQHSGLIGLAVDSSTQSYRLVAVDVKLNHTNWGKKVFKFTIFTARSCMWEEIHEEELVCELHTFRSRNILPVFLRNSMNWLIKDGSILAFDLEKRRARIIEGPIKRTDDVRFEYDVWFGGVQDSLVFVRALESEIVIYVYDYAQKKWQILHTIDNISRGQGNYGLRNGIPMLFNGKQLLFLYRTLKMERVIYTHDVLIKSWKRIGTMPGTNDLERRYIPFVPTLVKLNSGLYTQDPTLCSDIRGSLDGLHQLLKELCKTMRLTDYN